ncbi:nucleotidyltransferase domain-containing protein [Acholeplasma equirhinis]|uniref:nucleotidyltransferase family protein n=1 Tax=Acholeplasma equirhinis TaxID=555393 RepID=UPI00197AD245|nr:nucleotidyltransferase domain-containing protein [Acholeplasma equirhinis]MBN3490241.1 nucleotidyltransferase domain-containing protein [Acholeplasma equirhinis]
MTEKVVINDKLFYRFIEFTSKLIKVDLVHETFKQICLDQYTTQTKAELRVKKFADAFRYLIHNTSSDVTKELIETTYFILTSKKLSKKINQQILEKYYQRLDDHAQQKACQMHLMLIDLKISSRIEFAFLITNYILIKRGLYPIIVYPNDKKIYMDAINLRKTNPNQFYLFLVQAEHFVRKTHDHKILDISERKTKEEVIAILKSERSILQKKYYVKQLYLYGSYVKETNIATSDIDVLVILDSHIINYEKQEVMKKLRTYLCEIMAYRMDVMEFSHALTSLEIHEMTHVITII